MNYSAEREASGRTFKIEYFSMFSGIGGFELGIEQADSLRQIQQKNNGGKSDGKAKLQMWECVGYSEINKYAIATYSKHFPTHKNYGDATKINPMDLPDFDLLVGGFPCQAFSIAGKREGFKDTRGTLFFEIARVLERKQPRMLVLENVKGLLNHDGGNTFTKILSEIDELGYDAEWEVLNSKNFGVPQNRERVFIVGHLRGEPFKQVFPLGNNDEETDKNMTGIYHTKDNKPEIPQARRRYGVNGVSPPLNQQWQPKIISPCIRAEHHNTADVHFIPVLTSKTVRAGGQRSPHGSKQNWDSYEVNGKIRRLTPVECERLQGFPDGWTIGSDTQRYKQCGNAVTVNVVEAIINKMCEGA